MVSNEPSELSMSCQRQELAGSVRTRPTAGRFLATPLFTSSGLGVDHAVVFRVVRDRGGDWPLVGLHGH